jgi:hypothetical protein
MTPTSIISNTAVPLPSEDSVRPQIKGMSGFSSDESFEDALPDSTIEDAGAEELTPTGRKKRKLGPRKSKLISSDEIVDPIVKRFNERANSLGGSELVTTAFKFTGKPLETEEKDELNDFFYVLSKKGGFDVQSSWFLMGLYCVFMLVRFFIIRTDLGKQLEGIFTLNPANKGKKEEKE